MIGLGVDAVDVERFERVLTRTPGVATRMFTTRERSTVRVERLAARFAAKEAVMKALGVGLGAFGFHDVEVVNAPSGAPELLVTGTAAAIADRMGVTAWMVSLTHTDRTAFAVVAAL